MSSLLQWLLEPRFCTLHISYGGREVMLILTSHVHLLHPLAEDLWKLCEADRFDASKMHTTFFQKSWSLQKSLLNKFPQLLILHLDLVSSDSKRQKEAKVPVPPAGQWKWELIQFGSQSRILFLDSEWYGIHSQVLQPNCFSCQLRNQTDTDVVSILSTSRIWRKTFMRLGFLNKTLMLSLLTPTTSARTTVLSQPRLIFIFKPAILTSEGSLMEPLMRSSLIIECEVCEAVVSQMCHLALVAAANQRQLAEP